MKNFLQHSRWRRLFRWTAAGLAAGFGVAALLWAADSPTDAPAPAPGAPAAASPGTSSVFPPPKEGEVVAAAMRSKLLTVAKTFIERDNPGLLAKLTTAADPFYPNLPPPPTPSVMSGASGKPVEPPPPPKLTDEDKLAQVAAAAMPTGLIETATVRLVTFAKRDPVQVGQSFPVQFPNESTPSVIQVIDANETSCVLKLGDTTLSADFVANASATPAPRPAAPAASPSPTK